MKNKSRAQMVSWDELPALLGISNGHAEWFRANGWFPPSPDDPHMVVVAEARQGMRHYENHDNPPDWVNKRRVHAERQAKAAAARATSTKIKSPPVAPKSAPERIDPPQPSGDIGMSEMIADASRRSQSAVTGDIPPAVPPKAPPPAKRAVAGGADDPAAAAEAGDAPLVYDDPLTQAKYRKALAEARRAERLDKREAGALVAVRHSKGAMDNFQDAVFRALDGIPDMVPDRVGELREIVDGVKMRIRQRNQKALKDMAEADRQGRLKGDERG